MVYHGVIMVLRSFVAFDNDSLIVTSSNNGGIVGNPIVNNSSTPNGTVFQYTAGSGTEVELNDTGGGFGNFNDDNAANHVITDGGGIVADGTGVESESIIEVRALNSMGNPTGPRISIYVFSQNGNFSDVWGYATSAPLQDGVSYVKVDGTNSGTSGYENYITCFAEGTLIDTADGPIPVQDITVGQAVWTRESGDLPVRWVSTTDVSGQGAFAPVCFAPGAIGNDAELLVSQQHRVWVENAMAELLFGEREVLVAAKHLCGIPGVDLSPQERISYTHFMFDSHQIVRANGALMESFFYADSAVGALERAQREELKSIFPAVQNRYEQFGATVTMTLNAREAAALRPYLVA